MYRYRYVLIQMESALGGISEFKLLKIRDQGVEVGGYCRLRLIGAYQDTVLAIAAKRDLLQQVEDGEAEPYDVSMRHTELECTLRLTHGAETEHILELGRWFPCDATRAAAVKATNREERLTAHLRTHAENCGMPLRPPNDGRVGRHEIEDGHFELLL